MTAKVKRPHKNPGSPTKYTPETVKKILHLVASEDFTVDEICKQVGIAPTSFYLWQSTKPEFSTALKEADEKRLSMFKHVARSALMTLLKGSEVEETVKEFKAAINGSPMLKSMKTTKKKFLPNAIAAIFALKNTDSDNFADINRLEVSGKGPINISLTEE